MRLAVLSTSWPLRPGSSSGIFVQRLVQALPDEIDRTIITPCPDHPVSTANEDNLVLRCFRYAPQRWQQLTHRPGGLPVALKNNRMLILLLPVMLLSMLITCVRSATRADILHANWSLNGLVAGVAGLMTLTPVVTTLRGSDISGISGSFIRKLILRACLITNRKVITVNDTIRETVCTLYPKYGSRIVTIANGVDEQFLAIPARDQATADCVTITSIGNLNPNKGMQTILAALEKVETPVEIQLQIVGDGPQRDELQSLADNIRRPHTTVELTGSVSPDRIPELLGNTDIFVLASRAEGRPNVILEALAAARPVVASDIDGIRDLVSDGHTGLLFSVDDAEALSRQLGRLVQNPALRRQLGEAGRRYILDNRLTWEQCAARYSDLYKSCINGNA